MLKKFSREQLLVLAGACLTQLALIGTLVNATSILLTAVTGEFGIAMTRLSSYHTLKTVVMALAAASLSALFFRSNKAAYMGACLTAVIGGYLILIPGADGPLWWVSALLIGLGLTTCGICTPYMLGLWFPKNAGFATGIAMAFSGIGGVLFNPLASALISAFGWRAAMAVIGAITAALGYPGIFLTFRKEPPKAAEGQSAAGGQARRPTLTGARLRKVFALLQAVLVSTGLTALLANYIGNYGADLGYTLAQGANLASFLMAGNVLGKLLFGAACDRWSVWRCMQVSLLLTAAATAGLLFCTASLPLMYLSAFLFGTIYGMGNIGMPRGTAAAYDPEQAKRNMGKHTALSCAISAVFSFLVGPLYDLTGSFKSLLWFYVVMLTGAAALAQLLKRELKQ